MHDHGNCARCDAVESDLAAMRGALVEAERGRDALRETIAEIHDAIPATFYAGLGIQIFRVEELVRTWSNAIKANARLEADLAAMRVEIEKAIPALKTCARLFGGGGMGGPGALEQDCLFAIRALDRALASSPGAAWLATAREVVEAATDGLCKAVTCGPCSRMRALLARAEVQEMRR